MKCMTAILGIFLSLAPASMLFGMTQEEGLFAGVASGNLSVVQERLAGGASVNARDSNGRTPLHFAARLEDWKVADLLISNGADVNARDALGKTPLHVAAFERNVEMIAFLLGRCADINVRDDEGRIPLASAQRPDRVPSDVMNALFEIARDRAFCSK